MVWDAFGVGDGVRLARLVSNAFLYTTNRSVVDGAFDSIVGVFLLFELGMALVGCGVLQLLLCLLAIPCKRASCWEAREVAEDKLPVLLWWSLVPAGTDFKEWVLVSLFLGVVHLCSQKCVE